MGVDFTYSNHQQKISVDSAKVLIYNGIRKKNLL